MRARFRHALASVVLASATALASEPCALVADSEEDVPVRLTVPAGAIIAGATVVVDYPERQVGIPGEGTELPKSTIADKASDAMAAANDSGDTVRVAIARPSKFDLDAPIFTLRFQRCQGAKPATAEAFGCTVRDAADPAANKVPGVGCKVALP